MSSPDETWALARMGFRVFNMGVVREAVFEFCCADSFAVDVCAASKYFYQTDNTPFFLTVCQPVGER